MENREHRAITIEESDSEGLANHSTNEIEESLDNTFVTAMEKRLEEIRREGIQSSSHRNSVCIYRAPQGLAAMSYREVAPEIVSIGPYHRGKDEFLEFENYKWHFLDSLLSRNQNRVNLRRLVEAMKGEESLARSYYSELIPMLSEDFIQMMVLDGCFVVELLQQVVFDKDYVNPNSPIFMKPWLIQILMRDLLKLENQLPLFVIKRLFDICIGNSSDPLKLLALKFFNLALPRSLISLKTAADLQALHLLDLFHLSYLPSNSLGSIRFQHPLSDQSMPCVTRLQSAGIKFRPPRNTTDSFLKVNFRKGVLEIPPITVNDFTSTAFINCVAYEQCRQHIPTCFSAYIAFMSCLINSDRDVAFLCDDGIITNFFRSDQHVAQIFKELGENVVFDIRDCYFSKQFREVEAYYNSNWATLRRTYFSSPWSFISVVSASVLLAMTGIQAIVSILSYKVHHS